MAAKQLVIIAIPHISSLISIGRKVTLFIEYQHLNLIEMHTVVKQAICVSVLQMCCKCAANMEISNDKQTRTQLLQR